MMQCVRRCSFICGAVLSILLLLCSCQAGAVPLILPDNVPSKNTSQGKEKLLAALNTIGIRRPETTQDSYIPGADSVAETIFLCIQQESGNNAAAAIKLLSESRTTGLANCADVVLNRLSPSPDETYLVSYALLSADGSVQYRCVLAVYIYQVSIDYTVTCDDAICRSFFLLHVEICCSCSYLSTDFNKASLIEQIGNS